MANGLGAYDHVMAGNPPRSLEDARIAKAKTLLPILRPLFEMAKAQHDAIGETERKCGPENIRHLSNMLFDLYAACDNLICDLGDEQ